jgi:2-polyprenyl-3-methyl-5-hydroxy-6-metoxy-1,4-benzoquinol methylase
LPRPYWEPRISDPATTSPSPAPTAPAIVGGYNDQVRDDVIPLIPESAGVVLDVGGGTGATAGHLKRIGRATRVGTVDLVRAESPDPELDFQLAGNLDDEEFVETVVAEQGPFDTILCLDVLEHLVDPWRVVEQLHERLRPGGVLIVSVPNVRHYRVSGGLLFRGRWQLQDAGICDRTHLRFFVRDTAIELATHSGLVLEEVRTPLPERRTRLVHLFRRITFGLLDDLTTIRYLVRARRPQ